MKQFVFPYTEREAEKAGVSYSSEDNRNCLFARRLAQLRAEEKMSQQKLADMLEVSKSTISLYETGDTVPDAKSIVKMANIFGVSCDYFLCQSEYPTRAVEDMSIKDARISEKAACAIADLDKIEGEGFVDYIGTHNRPSVIFNRLCEDERFPMLVEYLEKSCVVERWDMSSSGAPILSPGDINEAIKILFICGKKYITQDEYRQFNLQRACDVLKAIVEDMVIVPEEENSPHSEE